MLLLVIWRTALFSHTAAGRENHITTTVNIQTYCTWQMCPNTGDCTWITATGLITEHNVRLGLTTSHCPASVSKMLKTVEQKITQSPGNTTVALTHKSSFTTSSGLHQFFSVSWGGCPCNGLTLVCIAFLKSWQRNFHISFFRLNY